MSEERKSRYELFLEEEARRAEPTKECSKCHKVKALGEYRKDKSKPLGVSSRCKTCLGGPKRKSPENTFWKFFNTHYLRVGDCLEWQGRYGSHGTPCYEYLGKNCSVRRLVYKLAVAEVSCNMFITTKCENVRCVRQSHLIKVTQEEMDTILRNKTPRGEKNGNIKHRERRPRGTENPRSKLNDEGVREIRRLHKEGMRFSEIARAIGMSSTAVSWVISGKTWSHVE